MQCRIGLALGRAPSEVRALPASDYILLCRYWDQEPWGSERDNIHAGMVAAAVYNASGRYKNTVEASSFLLSQPPPDHSEDGKRLAAALSLLAGGKKK